jgi:hypothetical protein
MFQNVFGNNGRRKLAVRAFLQKSMTLIHGGTEGSPRHVHQEPSSPAKVPKGSFPNESFPAKVPKGSSPQNIEMQPNGLQITISTYNKVKKHNLLGNRVSPGLYKP